MSRLYIFVLMVLSLAGAYTSANAYVMGRDNRQEINKAEAEQPEIMQTGVIRIGDGSFVTGVLTGANCDVVISAGHAAIYWRSSTGKGWRKGQIRGGGRFRFYPDPGGNRKPGIAMRLVRSGLQNPADIDKDDSDWSIFRLIKPVPGGCRNISYVANGIKCNGHTMMPAFHFDRRNTRLIDRACKIKDSIGSDIVVHDCDTKDGSSGAPLLCESRTGMVLLAINISGLTPKEYVEPGVYGKESLNFDFRHHKNFAVTIHGEFLRALESELEASRERKGTRVDN